ncbi:MAG: YicC family protein [Acidobacteria bacterium]|nr:YicC family protein [Acidobacteriota bacterium]
MVNSMTGYGRGSSQNDVCKVVVEIRTLNSRYQEVHVHLPKEYPDLELDIKRRIKKELARGRADVNCTLETNKLENVEVNADMVRHYVSIFKQIKDELGLGGDLSVSTIAQLPGVIVARNDKPDFSRDFTEHLEKAMCEALRTLKQSRSEEGRILHSDIQPRLDGIVQRVHQIEAEEGKMFAYYRNKLMQRIRELSEHMELDDTRLIQEAAYHAERSDIAEEILRLRSHTQKVRDLLQSDQEIGKQIDFLLQEMNREITTILAKAGGVLISEAGVLIKAEIEKIREQIQNIE